VYWVKTTYGDSSNQYYASIPHNSVWLSTDSCLFILQEKYLYHPAYRFHPVVGITQQQALRYSKWRSDRVFEYILIKKGIVEYNLGQDENNFFTIEKYFNGNYNGIVPDTSISYPDYRLPNLKEREIIIHFSDSVNKLYYKRCFFKKCKDCATKYPDIQAEIEPCINDTSFYQEPTRQVFSDCVSKAYPLYNLKGNVSEWSTKENISFGGSWMDSKARINASDIFHTNTYNAWTGFRDICQWKKWKK